MIIKVLVENTTVSPDFGSEHGLSLFIETKDKRILFDVGESNWFLRNAKKMDVDLADVDYVFISHGHDDHGGGLERFFELNERAKVFLQQNAFNNYYAIRSNNDIDYIGLDQNLKDNDQIILTSNKFIIDESMEVFSSVKQTRPLPNTNSGLMAEENGFKIEDSFSHEQNLVIEQNGKKILITGCAHNGIVNILEHFNTIYSKMPDYVIGGFHLTSSIVGDESNENIQVIGEYLLETKAKYFTGHCTGKEPYTLLKRIMGEAIEAISTGLEFEI